MDKSAASAAGESSTSDTKSSTSSASGTAFDWRLPKGFPAPRVPEDNPMTQENVELGRYLFYDRIRR